MNSDGSGFNDNLFIPASGNGLTFTGGPSPSYDTLVNFLKTLGTCATDQIGSTFERNSCRAPWINNLNARFTLRLPYKKVKTDITLDILNVANLLNHNWGEQRFVNFNQIANVGDFVHERSDHRLQPGHNQPDDSGHVQPVPVRRRPVALADAARRQDFVLVSPGVVQGDEPSARPLVFLYGGCRLQCANA